MKKLCARIGWEETKYRDAMITFFVVNEMSKKYVEDIQKSAEQSEKFNEELAGLTSNLNNLNKVYGGMLSAMKA